MADEVDEIAAAWRAERPDLDTEPLQVLSRISRIAQLLDERRARPSPSTGWPRHEFDVLAALRRSGPPYEQTPGQLIEATHVTSGTMTNRLDRLVERNLVLRRAHPADGRQINIRLDRGRPAQGGRGVRGACCGLSERGSCWHRLPARPADRRWPPGLTAGCWRPGRRR